MGTGTLFYGVTNWYSNGEQIGGMDLPASFTNLSQIIYGVPLPALYVAVISIVFFFSIERLPLGRNLYVIGANVRAAQLTGINIRRHVTGAFVASGLLSGFAGIVLGSILHTGTPSVGPGHPLPAFAGALLGATSIKPGRVNVVGTLLSVLVLAFSFSGVQQLGAPFYLQYFFNGGILIVAVGLSVYESSGAAAPPRSRARPERSMHMDPFETHDKRFNRCMIPIAFLEKLHTGMRGAEGPAHFGDHRCLIFSDLPSNRLLRWDEETVAVTTFRSSSNFSNGNTRDRQGRLLTCEHRGRRVTRTEHDGTITIVADQYQSKRLNSPNDIVVKSDGTIWFTDPSYGISAEYEGGKAESEIGSCNVYRFDPRDASLKVVVDDFHRPNGLAFSPDELTLYIADSGFWPNPTRRTISGLSPSARTVRCATAGCSRKLPLGSRMASASTSKATSGLAPAMASSASRRAAT